MPKNVVIPSLTNLEKIKKDILRDGKEKLHVLSDFDRTLTYAFVKGEKMPSLISILRSSGDYLGDDYAAKAQALYEKYHPIEINLDTPLKERKKSMEEWWRTHFKLLIESGLNKKHLVTVVKSPMIKFREGALKFFDTLYRNEIPLVIMSASGLGGDAIAAVLKKAGKLYSNIHIVSNSFSWNKGGRAVAVKEPIIHTLNKDETILKDFSFYEKIENRKNVLLLGDNLEDMGMIEGFNYKHLIKVGFLNENIEENLEHYKKFFDVLILNDSSMKYANLLLKEITKELSRD